MSKNKNNNNGVQVKDLSVVYTYGNASFKAVKNVDFDIKSGEIVGLIGESGSGKTSTAKAILGQIPFFSDGVNINGIDIPHLPELKTKKLKNRIANNIQMIYQSPSASLNPYKRVWKAVAEGMYNIKLTKEEGKANVDELQKKFVGQIFEYNNVLKSKAIEIEIEKYNTVLSKITAANDKKLDINKDNLTFLKNEDLVTLDKKYNDIIDLINNKIGSLNANLQLRIDSAQRNTKKKFKAHYENVDIETSVEIKELSTLISKEQKNDLDQNKTQFIALKGKDNAKDKKAELTRTVSLKGVDNKTKLATMKVERTEKLRKINVEMKYELDKINAAAAKLIKDSKTEKNKLNEQYEQTLKEYQSERTKLIKRVRKSDVKAKTSKDLKESQLVITKLYGEARKLDDGIRKMLTEEAQAQGKSEQFIVHQQAIDAKLKKAIKYSRKPFGNKKDIKARAIQLIEEVGLNKKIAYSHIPQLSGGQQQRVAIARAFAMKPKFIIADEPIASLDVSLQGSVVNLIKDFAEKRGTAVLFITHDLDMVRRIASRMLVMYRGNIVERGNTKNVFDAPIHPYTRMLMSSSLTIDEALEGKENYIYTGKEHIESKEKVKYHKVGVEHEILANSKEVKAWGDK